MNWAYVRLALVATLVAVAAAAAPALAQAAPPTSVTMYSDPSDWVGGGQQRFFYPGNGSVSASGNAGDVTINVSGGTSGDYYTMEFAAPPGQTLAPAVYDNAQRAPFRQAGRPGIDIYGDGRGCNTDSGRFEVKDIATDSGGAITRLWIVYEQHCEGGLSALFGEVRYGEPPAAGATSAAPAIARWPAWDFGHPGTAVPVTVVASSAATITGVSVAGGDAGDFPVRLDGCSGQSLAAGGTCPVWVAFSPTAPGTRISTLRVTDSRGGETDVALQGFSYGGTTRVTMHSDSGDWVGGGSDYSYTPANATIGVWGSPEHVEFSVSGDNTDWWTADFAAPAGNVLAAGDSFDGATRYPFNNSGSGLDVTGNGRGCNTVSGSFTVTDATYGPDNSPRSFGVNFEQHCEGASPALHGTFDFRVGDTTPPAPWMAGGGAYPVAPGPTGGSPAGTIAVPTDAPGDAVPGRAGVPSSPPACVAHSSLRMRVPRVRGYSVRRVDIYLAGRRVARVKGRALGRAIKLHPPHGPFRLLMLIHATRHGHAVTLRATAAFDACGNRRA